MKGITANWNIKNQLDQPLRCVLSIAPGTLYSTVDQNGNELWRARVQVFGSLAALEKARKKPEPSMGAGAFPGAAVGPSNPALEEFDLFDLPDEPQVHPRDLVYAELMKRHADAERIEDTADAAAGK
jgi:hypothetical protein